MTKLLTLRIIFPIAVRAIVVAKLVILGTLPLTSFILVLREALVAKLVISGILSLTISFFTTSLSLLKSTGTVTNQHLIYLL